MKRKRENSRTHLLCTYNPRDKWRPSSPLKQKLLDFYVPYLRGQLTSPYHDHQVLNLRLQNEVKMEVSYHRRPPSLITSISSPGLLGLQKRGQKCLCLWWVGVMQRWEATAAPEEGRGLSIMAYTGKLRRKGYLFSLHQHHHNDYSSSPHGLWVNSPWGRASSRSRG